MSVTERNCLSNAEIMQPLKDKVFEIPILSVVDPETGKRKALWAFVGVLGFSRYMMVRFGQLEAEVGDFKDFRLVYSVYEVIADSR